VLLSRFRLSALLAIGAMLASTFTVPVPVAGAPNKVRLVVTFEAGTPSGRADAVAAASGGTVVDSLPQLGVRVVELPAPAVANARGRWARSAEVAQVEMDGLLAVDWLPTDPLWAQQWEQRQIRTPGAWDLTRGTATTIVAVVDTGVQPNHPDLVGKLVAGYDFVNTDSAPADDNGHGTAVAGVIAAVASNGVGVSGTCSGCRVMPVKALGANGQGYWSVAAKSIMWAADHGADVINLSFGGSTGGSTLGNAVAYARSKGVVVVGSSGNSGVTSAFYPAAYPGVISVAASNDLDHRYSWSNYSTSWVTLAAPGCTWSTKRTSTYGSFCGTSAAGPVVAGVAALVESKKPSLTRAQIEEILRTATVKTPTAYTRYGRIDAYAAVHRAAYGTAPVSTFLTPSAPLLSPQRRVVFNAGFHTGYRFDPSGAILVSRPLTLGSNSGALTSSRSAIPGRSGHWFYITNGGMAGHWVKESSTTYFLPDATPTPDTTPAPTASPTPVPTPVPAPSGTELQPSAPLLSPTHRVVFLNGTHIGYRFSTSGAVLSTRPMTLGATSGADASKVATLPGRSGAWFRIVNGGLAGYWLQASSRAYLKSGALPAADASVQLVPTSPIFSPKQRVAFAAGKHIGYRFSTAGTVLSTRPMTLGAASGASSIKRMALPGQSGQWLYIVDGGLAGHWIRESTSAFLRP
jgi:subtilisin family serine protease